MNRTILALLFVGLVAGHLSHGPHHHHDADEDHDEDHHHGHIETNLRPVCPFLAILVPKLEGVTEEMDQNLRSANTSLMKAPHGAKMAADIMQAKDYDLLMEKLANAVETSVVAVYPDFEKNTALTVFDIYYEEGAELLRSRWAVEVDEETGRWGLWQQGQLPGEGFTPTLPEVNEVVHALKEVGHAHECKTLGSLLSKSAEFEVANADEFDFSRMHMGKRHGHRHGHSDDEGDRPMYERLVGRDIIQQVCEKWAAGQTRHITMQFVHPEEMFYRHVYNEHATYDVLVTGSVEMKTVFADKVVHWPGAVRMTAATKNADGGSAITKLKVYTLEATSLESKWGWKYGSGGMAGWFKAMIAFGSVAAVLVCLCCLCGVVSSAACSTMWSQYFFTRCRSRRTVRAPTRGSAPAAAATPAAGQPQRPTAPAAAVAPQPGTARSDLAVPLRSAPLVPAPPTTVTPQ